MAYYVTKSILGLIAFIEDIKMASQYLLTQKEVALFSLFF